jgi:hypothetical protein
MRLQADAIDANTSVLHLFDQRVGSLGLVASILDTIIVVVELDVFARGLDCFLGELVRKEEVIRSDGVVLMPC